MRVEAPASAAVSVCIGGGGGLQGQVDGEDEGEVEGEGGIRSSTTNPVVFASTSSRSASLRKKIVSFVFDKTRKHHGRFMVKPGGGNGSGGGMGIRLRRGVERSTV